MSLPSTHKNPLTLAKEKLAAAQAAEEAARNAAKAAKKADKQALKEAEKAAQSAAKPLKPGKKAPPRVETLRAAPPVIDPEVDDEGIDPDEESEAEFIEDTEGEGEEDESDYGDEGAESDPGEDDDDQEADEEDVGDDTGEDSDPAPSQSAQPANPTPGKRGRGKRGPGKPVDPRIAQILGEIDNAQTRRVSINVCKRVLPLVFSYEEQFSKVSKSAERQKVLDALKDLVGAVECFVDEMRAVRQDWVARRGTAKPEVAPGTLVRLTEKALPEFGEFLPEGEHGKLVDLKPGKMGRVLFSGRHVLLPLAALEPADD